LRWYIQRKGNTEARVLADAVKDWIKMLAPYAPFMCEELWSQAGEKGFISVAKWPISDPARISIDAEEQENLVTDVMADTNNILKAMKIAPTRIIYYTAAPWKWQVYLKIVEKTISGDAKINELMRDFAADPNLKPYMKDIAPMVPRIIKALTKVPSERKVNMQKIGEVNEEVALEGATTFIKDRFNAETEVYIESDEKRFDPKRRASMALPYQPAIYIE
jgi:leucyl-tRNA synthetase